MAERRKPKKRKELQEKIPLSQKPSKNEYRVAKYLKQHLPTKKTKFLNYVVEYFIAVKAVDLLMESPWAKKSKKYDFLFADRTAVVQFLDLMLQHKFFHRAKKVPVAPKDLSLKSLKKLKEEEKKRIDKKKAIKSKTESEDDVAKEQRDLKEKKEEEEKKDDKHGDDEVCRLRKRVRLDMHLEQLFVDGNEAYVWLYDPVPFYYWIAGLLLVIAAILICLYPLWPPVFRTNVQYLCFGVAGILLLILPLALLRLLLFCLIWLFSFGKHHLWIFPNLIADVGFFASFWPLYEYKYYGEPKKQHSEQDGDSEGTQRELSEADDEREPSDCESGGSEHLES